MILISTIDPVGIACVSPQSSFFFSLLFYFIIDSNSSPNSLPANDDCLLIAFSNSLGTDQAQRIGGLDLDRNSLPLCWYS